MNTAVECCILSFNESKGMSQLRFPISNLTANSNLGLHLTRRIWVWMLERTRITKFTVSILPKLTYSLGCFLQGVCRFTKLSLVPSTIVGVMVHTSKILLQEFRLDFSLRQQNFFVVEYSQSQSSCCNSFFLLPMSETLCLSWSQWRRVSSRMHRCWQKGVTQCQSSTVTVLLISVPIEDGSTTCLASLARWFQVSWRDKGRLFIAVSPSQL
jgi:hypothetical protein